MLRFLVLSLSLLAAVVAAPFGCATAPNTNLGDEGEGEGEGEGDPATGNSRCDDVSNPCSLDQTALASCTSLIDLTCGTSCTESPSCNAAHLLFRHEPESCADALNHPLTYAPCVVSTCETLMNKVCGGTTPSDGCASNPGCGPATTLYQRTTSGASSAAQVSEAEASCASALSDESVFAPCP